MSGLYLGDYHVTPLKTLSSGRCSNNQVWCPAPCVRTWMCQRARVQNRSEQPVGCRGCLSCEKNLYVQNFLKEGIKDEPESSYIQQLWGWKDYTKWGPAVHLLKCSESIEEKYDFKGFHYYFSGYLLPIGRAVKHCWLNNADFLRSPFDIFTQWWLIAPQSPSWIIERSYCH